MGKEAETSQSFITKDEVLRIISDFQSNSNYKADVQKEMLQKKCDCAMAISVSFFVMLLVLGIAFLIYQYNINSIKAYTEGGYRIKREVSSQSYSDYWSKE